jgi:hypothetical protein
LAKWTTKKRAVALTARWRKPPTLSRAKHAEYAASEISEACWKEIEWAWHEYGDNEDALKSPSLDTGKNAKNSWQTLHGNMLNSLDRINKEIDGMLREDSKFSILSHSDTYLLYHEYEAYKLSPSNSTLIFEAKKALRALEHRLSRTEPDSLEVLSDAAARERLTWRLFSTLKRHGHQPKLSSGYDLGGRDQIGPRAGIAEADLTWFEQLISASDIHAAATPLAHAKWVRTAIHNGGQSMTGEN